MKKLAIAFAAALAIGALSGASLAENVSTPNKGNGANAPNTDSTTAHNTNVNSTNDNGGSATLATDPNLSNGND